MTTVEIESSTYLKGRSTYRRGRSLGGAPYQFIAERLLTLTEKFLETTWKGGHRGSHGIRHGYFNKVAYMRRDLWDEDPQSFLEKAIPYLEQIRDDVFSEAVRKSSIASDKDYELFSRQFDDYVTVLTEQIPQIHWLALRVQEHFKEFAGKVDSRWKQVRRLDPYQPLVDTKLFVELAILRDRVFESTEAENVRAYFEEVERLKAGDYFAILSYVQNHKNEKLRLSDYDAESIEALEDELSVEALWLEQSRGCLQNFEESDRGIA